MGSSSSKPVTNHRLDGKTAVITGCNSGIGKITAKEFYRNGARVIMACRDLDRANKAVADITRELESVYNVGQLIVIRLDLSSLNSVRQCASDIMKTERNIHILINNAGIMLVPKGKTCDGFELHFGVNHLGHFLFTCLLLPMIVDSAPARIVNVSALAHTVGTIEWGDLNWERRPYSPVKAYAQSKLANILFSVELSRRLKDKGVNVYSLHPGIVKTELGRYLDETYFSGMKAIAGFLFAPIFKTPEEGALTTLFCSLDETVANQTGLYYSNCKVKEPSAIAQNVETAARLWKESSKLVQLDEDIMF